MQASYLTLKKNHIVYDADLLDQLEDGFFTPAYWQARDAVTGMAHGRGSTLFVGDGSHEYVLRHYRRGGLPARLSGDRYLWTGLANSRPWREWHLLARLAELGLPAPPPVAARVLRKGLFYTADLATLRLPGDTLAQWLGRKGLAEQGWQAVGVCIRRFHAAGVCHADLNAHNILLDEDGRVSLLDFDRGHMRTDGAWQQANLGRLRRSLRKLSMIHPVFHYCDKEDWSELLTGYGA